MRRAEQGGEEPFEKADENSAPESPGIVQRLKQHAKDAVVAGTSTHGGVAGGIGGRRSRRKRQ